LQADHLLQRQTAAFEQGLASRRDAPQYPTQDVGAGDDPPLLAPDQDDVRDEGSGFE